MTDWNTNVIEEFRQNGGAVGGMFEGAPLLLLHHTGAKTGAVRVSPLLYQQGDHGLVVFASKAGYDFHPHWYLNIKANPRVTVELGEKALEMIAREADADERQAIWTKQKAEWPQFGEYEQKTDREIPVIILEAE
ncbi:MAG: nitroreductase family deazaflavin-dependent oxidoreductase [Acidimicrobiia bacterium]|nr:nitroreductase family deazaflavin-dependent oxidoreductase [Acidimicrobiia bacterium]